MLSRLVGGFVTIMIGVSLLPEFANPTELIGWTVTEEPKQLRQTYLDFVHERLEVEKLLK